VLGRRSVELERITPYAGGFLGPLGGGVVVVLIPDLRQSLHTTTTGAAVTLTVYLIPFALLQLASGTLGERIGLERTIRAAYVVYAFASAAVVLTTSLLPFLALRAIQGGANAFTTPLLVATLANTTRRAALGRAMATFAAAQTVGSVTAPLVGGLAGAVDYRLAFIGPAATALLLAVAPLPRQPRQGDTRATLRSAITRRSVRLAAFAFFAYMSTVALGFLVALRAADTFGLSSGARGLLLACFALAGAVAGRPIGVLIDGRGAGAVLFLGASASALVIPLVGLAPSVGWLALAWALAGVASQTIWAAVFTLSVDAAPNRAGAVSFVGACRFTGNALAPFVWLPLYHIHGWLPFVGAGSVLSMLVLGASVKRKAIRPVLVRPGCSGTMTVPNGNE
jgi:MFS family permease